MAFINTAKIWVKFDRNCMKQDKITFNSGTIVNFYIVYEVNLWPYDLGTEFTIRNCLCRAISLIKNV